MGNTAEGIVEKAGTYKGTVVPTVHYSLKGETLTRLVFWNPKSHHEFLNRKNYDPDSVYALEGVIVKIFEKGESDHCFESKTDALGHFEFKKLEQNKEYILTAILKIKDNDLQEEVTVEGIKAGSFPPVNGKKSLSLKQSNFYSPSAKTRDVSILNDKDEEIEPILTNSGRKKTLDFTKNSALLFGTFMLNVPYINQLTNSVYIDEVGVKISGGTTCFPTSMAMMMKYYGLKYNTTQSWAEEVYNLWKNSFPPFDKRSEGLRKEDNYDYVFKIVEDSKTHELKEEKAKVWQAWIWVNRLVRKTVGLTTTNLWKDNNFRGELPRPNSWCAYCTATEVQKTTPTNLLKSSDSYLRRNIGRGYLTVTGTNAPGGGHIMIIRGLVLRKDGTISRVIFNDPYGNLEFNTRPINQYPRKKGLTTHYCGGKKKLAGKNETNSSSAKGRAVFYNSETWGYGPYDRKTKTQYSPQSLMVKNYITLRYGFNRDEVRDRKLVHG
jgi:hypothetical protein